MTENKRFSVKNNWIKDNYIGVFLNIDFNTITDANLCCDLLNQIEDEKKQNGKIASKFLEENKELKEINQDHQDHILLLEEEKINLQIKLQKIRDYAMENGEVKQDVIEKVVFE